MARGFSYSWGEPDDSGEEDFDELRSREPRCKFCGSTDVRWRQQGGKWVLFALEPGKLHECRNRAASPDEFDDGAL